MTTAVVISDSHGHRSAVARVAPLFEENDLIIFLGDGVGDLYAAQTQYPEKTYLCRGNNDFSGGAHEWVIEEDGCRIYCCHGHRLGVKHGLERLAQEAKEHGCEIALYGHTHRAAISWTAYCASTRARSAVLRSRAIVISSCTKERRLPPSSLSHDGKRQHDGKGGGCVFNAPAALF